MKNIFSTDVPSGWAMATLDDVAQWGSGGTPSRNFSHYYEGSIPWVKTGELGPKYIRGAEEHITEEAIQKSSAKIFPAGSVGIAMYGATIGKASIWAIDASTNQACAVAQPYGGVIHNLFLYYFLLSEKRGFIKAGKGGAQPNISQGVIKEWKIKLPPNNEQHRIVAKIEELFSELDNGVENLKTSREQLKVYRQAVLKYAFEGKLTADWRAQNKDKLETADQLLARIKAERETHYQQQLRDWNAAVKVWEAEGERGNKPATPNKQTEIIETDEDAKENLPDLPNGWRWLRLSHVADVSGGLTKNPKRNDYPHKMKYLRVANVYADRVLTDEIYEIGVTDAEAKKLALKFGDLLVVEGNGSVDQIGRVAMWADEVLECGHQNHLIRVRVATSSLPRFFLQFLLSPLGRKLIVKEASSTSGLHTLSISKVSNLAVPITTLAEETAILNLIEQKLLYIDRFLEEINHQLQKSEALRQSILKKAFSGQLVDQDPNDEPAAALLERIKAEKVAQAAPTKTKRKKSA